MHFPEVVSIFIISVEAFDDDWEGFDGNLTKLAILIEASA